MTPGAWQNDELVPHLDHSFHVPFSIRRKFRCNIHIVCVVGVSLELHVSHISRRNGHGMVNGEKGHLTQDICNCMYSFGSGGGTVQWSLPERPLVVKLSKPINIYKYYECALGGR